MNILKNETQKSNLTSKNQNAQLHTAYIRLHVYIRRPYLIGLH